MPEQPSVLTGGRKLFKKYIFHHFCKLIPKQMLNTKANIINIIAKLQREFIIAPTIPKRLSKIIIRQSMDKFLFICFISVHTSAAIGTIFIIYMPYTPFISIYSNFSSCTTNTTSSSCSSSIIISKFRICSLTVLHRC